MKSLILGIFLVWGTCSLAQNVGIGTSSPEARLEVNGSFKVGANYRSSNAVPTPAQTYTMVNAATLTMPVLDSVGRVYDPGGPAGNYIANIAGNFLVAANGSMGASLEMLIENINLGSGDSLIVYDGANANAAIAYQAGNNFTASNITVRLTLSVAYCVFKSNADASLGTGFSIFFKRMYLNNTVPEPVVAGEGLLYYPQRQALRVGLNSHANVGRNSTAIGYQTTAGDYGTAFGFFSQAPGFVATAFGRSTLASGAYSTASGFENTASGSSSIALGSANNASNDNATAMGNMSVASGRISTAIGYRNTASGEYSTAIGYRNTGSGDFSTALGYNTIANGTYSIAMGSNATASGTGATVFGSLTTASGIYSTAMGNNVSTNNFNGSFIIGDNQTSLLNSTAAHQMTMRFSGGYRLFTNAGSTVGLTLAAGGSSWATVSDYRKKENYQPANGTAFLEKIAAMQLGSWNYIGQDKKEYRHYGPMAQEFYKNFGDDGIGSIGTDTTIASADIDGVMMIALQALVQENRQLKLQQQKLEARLQKMEAMLQNKKYRGTE